jgi:hypothetical protein
MNVFIKPYGKKLRVCKTIKPQDNIVFFFFKLCKCTPSLEDCTWARVKQTQPNESPYFTLSMRETRRFSHQERPRCQPYHDRQKKETSTLNLTKPNKCSIQRKIQSTTSELLRLAVVHRALATLLTTQHPLPPPTTMNHAYLPKLFYWIVTFLLNILHKTTS